MTDDLARQLRAKPTGELVAILRARDAAEWRSEVFPIVETILGERGVDTEAVKAIGPPGIDTVEFADLERVSSHRTQVSASLCRMALAQVGIEAWLSTGNVAGISPPLGLAIGIDVLVRSADSAPARALLAELESRAARIGEEPQACPRCGATDTEHERKVNRASAVANWALAGTPLPIVEHRWRCGRCGNVWD